MKIKADSSEKVKSRSNAHSLSKERRKVQESSTFIDNRPEATVQLTLQRLANLHSDDVLGNVSLHNSRPEPITSNIIQLKAKPGNDVIRDILESENVITNEPGSCDSAMRSVFKELLPFVDDVSQLGSVVLWWTEAYDADAQKSADAEPYEPEGHTAVLAHWDDGTSVIDASMSQFGGPDLFIGTVADWRSKVKSCANASAGSKGANVTNEVFESKQSGLLFTSQNKFFLELEDYFMKTPPGMAIDAQREARQRMDEIERQWEYSRIQL